MLLTELQKSKTTSFHPTAWGYELILDCSNCDKEIITDKNRLIDFCRNLIKEIKMVPHGKTVIEHFPNRDPGKEGWSFVQLIETSSITGHFVDNTLSGYINIFSCKDFSEEDAVAFVKEKLKPKSIKVTFLTRDA